MTKSTALILILLLVAVFGSTMLWYYNSYVPYVPQTRVSHSDPDHTIVADPSLLTPDHIKNFIAMLDAAERSYKVVDNEVWIRRSFANDINLLYNYTKKANDPYYPYKGKQ